MKHTIKKIMTLVLALAVMFSFMPILDGQAYAASSGSVYVKVTQNYSDAQKVLKYVNKERTKRGLKKLKLDKSLTNSAVARAAEVSIYVPMTSPHKRPNGKLTRTINSRINYECCLEGTYVSPKGAVSEWMSSPPHKKGILLKSAKSVGISCVTTIDGYEIFTLEFSNSKAKKIQRSTAKKKMTKKVPAKSKYLKKSYYSIDATSKMTVGKKQTAKVIYGSKYVYGPSVIANKSFKWSSSNTKVATVSKSGVIKAKKAGTAYIKAKLKNGTKFTIKKKITVKKAASSYTKNALKARQALMDYAVNEGDEGVNSSGITYYVTDTKYKETGGHDDYGWAKVERDSIYMIGFPELSMLRLIYRHETEETEDNWETQETRINKSVRMDIYTDKLDDPTFKVTYYDGWSYDPAVEYTATGEIDRATFAGDDEGDAAVYVDDIDITTGSDEMSDSDYDDYAKIYVSKAAWKWDNWLQYYLDNNNTNMMYTLGFPKMKK